MHDEPRQPPKVVAVILNYKNWHDTLVCAESVLRSNHPNFEVVIVDNGSPNGSMERFKAWANGRLEPGVRGPQPLRDLFHPPVDKPVEYFEYDRSGAEQGGEVDASGGGPVLVLIQTGDNLGYAGGNNVALRYASRRHHRPYVLILNSDTVVPPDFLSRAMNSMAGGPAAKADVLTFPAYFSDRPDRLNVAYIRERIGHGPVIVSDLPDDDRGPVTGPIMAHGGAMLISPDAPVRLIPEEYFLYYEEADYCKQIHLRGGTVAVQLDNPLYEGEAKSVGAGSPLQIYYTRRNKLAYCKRYDTALGYRIVLARMVYSTLKGCLRCAVTGERMAGRAFVLSLLDHLRGKMGKTWEPR